MDRVKFFLNRANTLFVLALLAGMLLPQGAEFGIALTLPALTIIFTITLLRMPRGFFRVPSKHYAAAIWGNVLNYLVLSNFIILASVFLVRNESSWIGMVLVAAVPASVSIIPLSNKLHAETNSSLAGFSGTYAGSLLITPLIGLAFLKFMPLNYSGLILLVELILLPLAISRLAIEKGWDKIVTGYKSTITDWCFFVVLYALAASSRYFLFRRPMDAIIITAIAVASTFLLGFVIRIIARYYNVPENKITSHVILGTLKNYGLAGGIAISVFNKEAALPAVIFTVVMFFYTLWLKNSAKKLIADNDKILTVSK